MAPHDTGADDFDEPFEEDFRNNGPRYGDVSELGGMEIPAALHGLTLFRDPYLSMQCACGSALMSLRPK